MISRTHFHLVSETKLQIVHCHACVCHFKCIVNDWFQTFAHQLEVGLVEDDLRQVLLPLDLFFDGVRDVWDHVGQDELGEVNNVL